MRGLAQLRLRELLAEVQDRIEEIVARHKRGVTAGRVYIDYEPVPVAHSELILEQQGTGEWAGVVQADLRDPVAIIHHPTTQRLIDFSRPVGVLLVSVLHFVGEETDIGRLIARYRRHLAPGSWLA